MTIYYQYDPQNIITAIVETHEAPQHPRQFSLPVRLDELAGCRFDPETKIAVKVEWNGEAWADVEDAEPLNLS